MKKQGQRITSAYWVRIEGSLDETTRLLYFEKPPANVAPVLPELCALTESVTIVPAEQEAKSSRATDGEEQKIILNNPSYALKVLGKVLATEGFFSYSDERLKTDVQNILGSESLQLFEQIRPVCVIVFVTIIIMSLIPHRSHSSTSRGLERRLMASLRKS